MSECNAIKDLLALCVEGELDGAQSRQVMSHLEQCASCREEVAAIHKVRNWLFDPAMFAPEDDHAWRLLPRTLAARARELASVRPWLPANLGSLGWTLSVAATLFFAFGLIWLANRTAPVPAAPAEITAPGNEAFIGKIRSVYAREATAQHLAECQDLLLDLVRAERSCQGGKYDVSREVARARELLKRKRLLDVELENPQVARAKQLCDEIENLLIGLSTAEKCENPGNLRRMEKFIQREQLLLRINVLWSELS